MDLIIPERLRARHWAGWETAMRTGATRYGEGQLLAVPALRKDGRQISIEFSIQLLKGVDDAVEWLVAFIRDVTERYDREKRLRAHLAKHRHRGRAGLRRALEARRLRAFDQRRGLLSGAGGSRRTDSADGAASAQSPGVPTSRIHSLLPLRQGTDWQLVEGTSRSLRVLSLPPEVLRCKHHEGAARGSLRRRAGAATANSWLHAVAEGVGPAGVARTQERSSR